ncbi:proprotein convertase subtilisin kexin type 5 [Stylonychia lemnae]|uniref:Proprotein convertase subtilisin kexin type 5 n=1 Tax=Stylonychia lemnae TaxID=5949 RepID=A0A078AF54_STYLE|nr:proprotein convertase subtilisin kexin type 5 [Stylonychia lemnae]|eukprot:CDW79543.1 proprotein convertase subtilisin kexin type 5 [Stylonychia lemnae]
MKQIRQKYQLDKSLRKQQTYQSSNDLDSGSRVSGNMYFTITSNKITVNATISPPYPGYRVLKISNVCTISGKCIDVAVPLIIWPSIQTQDAPKTPPQQLCSSTQNYPKVLGHPSYASFHTGADVDQDNGNFIACGGLVDGMDYNTNQYGNFGKAQGFILMSDINGRIYWFYSSTLSYAVDRQFFTSCAFSQDKYIYSIFLNINNNNIGLIKQTYEKGKIQYIKVVKGLYYSEEMAVRIFTDKYDARNIFMMGQRYDNGNVANYIMKIDVSQQVPLHVWSSDQSFSGYTIYHKTRTILPHKDHIYSMGTIIPNNWYFQLTKQDKQTGQALKMRHFLNWYLSDLMQIQLLIDENTLYVQSSDQIVSPNQTNYLRTYDLNLMSSNIQSFYIDVKDKNLDSPESCMAFQDVEITYTYSNPNQDYSNLVTQNIWPGDFRFTPYYGLYIESKQYPTEVQFQSALYLGCIGLIPQFDKPLENQIITLPSDPVEYTFNWPNDCNQNQLTFTWNVDRMTNAPSFIKVSNTSSSVTLNLSPTTKNVGTYSLRFRFSIIGKPTIYADGVIIVEVYPQIEYGQELSTEQCATRVTPAIFEKSSSYFLYTDMDQTGDFLLTCGVTKDSDLTYINTYYNSFISVYYRFIALKFHLTFEASQFDIQGTICKFGYKDLIYSIHQNYYSASQTDTLMLFQHENNGRFFNSSSIRIYKKILKADYMWIDPDNGDQYISGRTLYQPNHYNTLAAFILRIKHDYSYVFFKSYQTYEELEARMFQVDTTNNFIYWFSKHQQDDGSYIWGRRLYASNNYMQRDSDNKNQLSSLLLSQKYLYTCLPYNHNSNEDYAELHLTQHRVSDGIKLQSIQYSISWTPTTCIIYLQKSKNLIYLLYGAFGFNSHIAVADITNENAMAFKYVQMKVSTAVIVPLQMMFEVGNVLWYAVFRGSLPNILRIGKFINFQTFEWDEPCLFFESPINYFASRQLPYGPDGDQSVYWSNLDMFFEQDITKERYDAYSSFDLDFRVMQYNNRTANLRMKSEDCNIFSNPGLVKISDRLGEPFTAISGGFPVEVIKNSPPKPKDYIKSATLYAHHSQTWQVYLDYDLEFDEAKFSVSLLSSTNATITATWLDISYSDNQGIEFSILNPPQPPTGLNLSQYYIRVNVSDQFSRLTPNLTFIDLKILRNFSPFLSPLVNQTIQSIYITKSFSYTLWYQNFTDNENDQVIIDCQVYTTALNKDWISIEVNKTMPGNITFFGQTPRDNRFVGIYTFKCSAADQYDGALNIFNFTLNVQAKQQIVILQSQHNVSFRLPATKNLTFLNFSQDPLNEPNYYSLLVNNTAYNNISLPWLYWNNETLEIFAHPFSNSQGGNHSISIKFEDYISQSIFLNFTLEVIQNQPLVPAKQLNEIMVIANTWFYYDFVKTQIFINPEGQFSSLFYFEKLFKWNNRWIYFGRKYWKTQYRVRWNR